MLDIAMYLSVNAMTTVSAVVFLYAPATAVAMPVLFTSAAVRAAYTLVTPGWLTSPQAWRHR